jgi:biotin carboxyl carrier protein
MKYQVTVGGLTFQVEVHNGTVTVNGTEHDAELRTIPGTPLRLLLLDRGSWVLPINSLGGSAWEMFDGGERFEAQVLDERTAHIRSLVGAGAAPAGPAVLKAPMPGLVMKVHVEPGQEVAAGGSLVTLEAMKMENDLRATAPGIVKSVSVSPGETVEKGAILVTFGSS